MDAKDPTRDKQIRDYIRYCRIYGTDYVTITRIIEEPLFTPSSWRNLTQLADAISYCMKNWFVNESFFVKQYLTIANRFHKDPASGKTEGYGIKIYSKTV